VIDPTIIKGVIEDTIEVNQEAHMKNKNQNGL
jgi:hypothetical protein